MAAWMGESVRQIFQQPQISWVVFPNCWGTLHYCACILHVPSASRTAQVIKKKKVIGKSQAFLCDLIFSVGRGEQWGENTKTNYNTTHCGWQYRALEMCLDNRGGWMEALSCLGRRKERGQNVCCPEWKSGWRALRRCSQQSEST